MEPSDYYEFLQISPNAEPDTIHRVYKYLASRFHPDNPVSGNVDQFVLLRTVFGVLSDPKRRAEYDATRKAADTPPLSVSIDFMDGIQGELNRRGALLALLYLRRRTNPHNPDVSLAEVETRMGFPRDYLDFTIWYLRSKKYVSEADNGALALTALGVDYVESNHSKLSVLTRLLSSGPKDPTVNGTPVDHQLDRHRDEIGEGDNDDPGAPARQ